MLPDDVLSLRQKQINEELSLLHQKYEKVLHDLKVVCYIVFFNTCTGMSFIFSSFF